MFENVIGHEREKETLKNMILQNNISHAYLFSGKKGIGKRTLAFEFAKQLLHCDQLESCPDFKYICKKEDKKDIIVEQIRKEVIDEIYITPAIGDKKIYVIDDAQTLNIASQNALLKTLEEPPNYVVVILISSNISAFLTTIISRVNILHFENIKVDVLKQYIQQHYQIQLSDNILDYLDGSIGAAIEIIENRFMEKFEMIDQLYHYLSQKDIVSSMKYMSNIDFSQEYMLDYLEFVLYQNQQYLSIKIVERAKNRLKYNGNYDIVIDSMILKIIDSI